MCKTIYITLLLSFCAWSMLSSQPNLSSRNVIEGIAIYKDIKLNNQFYYAPLALELDHDQEGKPSFSFLKMVRQGSRLRGDERIKEKSVIEFSIRKAGMDRNTLKAVKMQLKRDHCKHCRVKLLPMPIRRIETVLIYANIDTDSTLVVRNQFGNSHNSLVKGSSWEKKRFVIRPEKFTSQMLQRNFEDNKALLSIGYAIWSYGKRTDTISYTLQGSQELKDIFDKRFSNNQERSSEEAIISTDVLPVDVDLERWPDLIQTVVFETTASPRYGMVDVYCYDFLNVVRPELIGKTIEFEAVGVGKGFVRASLDFNKNKPDTYAQELKFEYAVRLDQPLRYRVIEYHKDGQMIEGPWKQQETWASIIDISSQGDFESAIKTNKS